ncbi:choice-of-anchor E domain-containing protein [Pannus brasiliensis CCIBt3594]|uniref:Choice-of-anchor E domain-containing protein n=1 Tax=Pannus brasiliensis CCIBt3594 TaxID=1427578 RepID=A0AAW9QRM8_9CHRO
MKKMLSRVVLATGILALYASAANAAIFRYSQEVEFVLNSNQPAPDSDVIQLPKYNLAASGWLPLKSITLQAEGITTGSFSIINQGGRITFNSLQIGASTPISVPSTSPTTIELTPVPVTNFSGIVVQPNNFRVLLLDGSDNKQLSIPTSDFSLYQGTGTLDFPINAALVLNSNASFIPPIRNTQSILLSATTRLTVIYETSDTPLEIPERGFNILSLLFGGVAGLALKARPR